MGIMKNFAAMFGFGAACAKSSYDLHKQANSPSVRQGMAEYEYLYGKVPRMKGYNRVLEFDVIHAKIREILTMIGPETLEKYHLLTVSVKEKSQAWVAKKKQFLDNRTDYPFSYSEANSSFADMEIAYMIGWFDFLERSDFNLSSVRYTVREAHNMKERAYIMAQYDWYKANCSSYKTAGYNYREYLTEIARKTAYDNGYLPSCQNIDRNRLAGYANLYSGKIYPNGISATHIDWAFGIPDQEERRKCAERDATGTW